MSFISSFDFTVVPDPDIFLWIPESAAEAAVINPNGTNTLLANGWSTFFIHGKPTFSNDPKNPPWNPPNCIIEFLIILSTSLNHFQKPCKDLHLVYPSIINYVENYFHQYLSCLIIILELHQSHFLPQPLIYLAGNLSVTSLHCDTQWFYNNIT